MEHTTRHTRTLVTTCFMLLFPVLGHSETAFDRIEQQAENMNPANAIMTLGGTKRAFRLSRRDGYPGQQVVASAPNRMLEYFDNGQRRTAQINRVDVYWGDCTPHYETFYPPQTITHKFGYRNKDNGSTSPEKSTRITGAALLHTTAGNFVEHFTYEIWVDLPNSVRHGGRFVDHQPGTRHSQGWHRPSEAPGDTITREPSLPPIDPINCVGGPI